MPHQTHIDACISTSTPENPIWNHREFLVEIIVKSLAPHLIIFGQCIPSSFHRGFAGALQQLPIDVHQWQSKFATCETVKTGWIWLMSSGFTRKWEFTVIFHQPFHDDFMGFLIIRGYHEYESQRDGFFRWNQHWLIHPHFWPSVNLHLICCDKLLESSRISCWLVVGTPYPSEKSWSSSMGRMTSHVLWNN